MPNDIIIAPSILSGDFANMGKSVNDAIAWGADWIHCDVMDGVYVPNFTFGMPMVEAINRICDATLDVHLMMIKPEKYVERFVKAGADIVTFHPEASDNPLETINAIKNAGAKAGIVFNPDVDIERYEYLFDKCDVILVMTVFAGYGGQKFIPYCLDRIKKVKDICVEKGINPIIEVDGGIGEDNAREVIEAGARALVAGSAIYKSKDPVNTIKILRGVTK